MQKALTLLVLAFPGRVPVQQQTALAIAATKEYPHAFGHRRAADLQAKTPALDADRAWRWPTLSTAGQAKLWPATLSIARAVPILPLDDICPKRSSFFRRSRRRSFGGECCLSGKAWSRVRHSPRPAAKRWSICATGSLRLAPLDLALLLLIQPAP